MRARTERCVGMRRLCPRAPIGLPGPFVAMQLVSAAVGAAGLAVIWFALKGGKSPRPGLPS